MNSLAIEEAYSAPALEQFRSLTVAFLSDALRLATFFAFKGSPRRQLGLKTVSKVAAHAIASLQ